MIIDLPGASERRKSPRYVIGLSADMVLDNGDAVTVNTRNISSSGLQIICDSWVTNKIEPRGIQSHAITHLRFKMIIELPIADNVEKLYANCRVVSAQRLSQEEYRLNLIFTDFENNTKNTLSKFLDQYQQKKIVLNAISDF